MDRAINSYSVIKEMKIPADKIKDPKYNRKFKLMLERQLYFMSAIGKEKTVHAVSPYTGESHFTPHRFLGYSIPTSELVTLYNNTSIYLQRIDGLNNIRLNEDFYIELAEIFANLENINNVIIRGATKENIWVYATLRGRERIYHPIFIGYDLCTFSGNTIEDQHQQTIDPITQIQIEQNRYKLILSLIKDTCTKKIFLASFFVLVFDIYCQSFNKNYDSTPENAVVRRNMKDELAGIVGQNRAICVHEYIQEMFSRIDAAIDNSQAGENNIDQNPKISLENLSTAQEIYQYLKDHKQNETHPEPHTPANEENNHSNETNTASRGNISEYRNNDVMEFDTFTIRSNTPTNNYSPKSEEALNVSKKTKSKWFKKTKNEIGEAYEK